MGGSRIKFITREMCSLPGPAGSFCAGGKAGLDTCEGKNTFERVSIVIQYYSV